MLDRYIKIMCNLGIVRHLFDKLRSYSVHIAVHDTDHFDTFYLGQFSQEPGQTSLFIELYAVVGRILCSEDYLFYSPARKDLCLIKNIFQGTRYECSPDKRNGAKTASVQASFTDLKPGKRLSRNLSVADQMTESALAGSKVDLLSFAVIKFSYKL